MEYSRQKRNEYRFYFILFIHSFIISSSLLLRQLFLQTHVYFIYKVSFRLNYLDRNKKSEEVKSRSLLYLEVSMIVLKTCEECSS